MVERIRELLQARQLSPTQFADTIGVARPIVSHILGGRNKPSLEVVQKIIAAFPDVALPWLLSGQGDMLVSLQQGLVARPPIEAAEIPATGPTPTEELPDRPRTRKRTEQPQAGFSVVQGKPVAIEALARPEAAALNTPQQPIIPQLPSPIVAQPAATSAPTTPHVASPVLVAENKAIRRIVVFYQDGTFSDYRPSE